MLFSLPCLFFFAKGARRKREAVAGFVHPASKDKDESGDSVS
jgi:hypothetical protein